MLCTLLIVGKYIVLKMMHRLACTYITIQMYYKNQPFTHIRGIQKLPIFKPDTCQSLAGTPGFWIFAYQINCNDRCGLSNKACYWKHFQED